MPVYPFVCPEHGAVEVMGGFDQAANSGCPQCGQAMTRDWTISEVSHVVDFRPGWQPAFGKYVDTKRERDNLVAEKGLIRG